MSDMILTGLALLALIGAYPAVILADAFRRPARQWQVAVPQGAMTADGVPYVRGREPWRG